MPTSHDDTRSDEELMAAIALRDEAAFEVLYDRYASLLFGLCVKIVRSHNDAQAVLTDVFYEIWEKGARFDPSRVSARTYLVTVARSRAVDALRAAATRTRKEDEARRERDSTSEGQDLSKGPSDRAIWAEESQRVRGALEELSAAQREALHLAYFGGLTHVEIAARLAMPLGSVKSCIRQGLMKLRGALSPRLIERDR
jgi:RNA polymerase sigma-70 factor (ECF subfamily)